MSIQLKTFKISDKSTTKQLTSKKAGRNIYQMIILPGKPAYIHIVKFLIHDLNMHD